MSTRGESAHTRPDEVAVARGSSVADDAGPGSVWRGGFGRLTVGMCSTTLLIAFEAMAVATAMPVAVRELHGLRFYALAFGGFMAAVMFATVLAGHWGDRRGPLRPLCVGLVAFGAGLLLAGSARTMWEFVCGRAIQGAGAGLIVVAQYLVVALVYPERFRPRVFAALASAWLLPSIVGPVIAGVITEQVGWRWVFLVIIPIIAAPVSLMLPMLRRLRRTRRATPPADSDGQEWADAPSVPPGGRRILLFALAAAVGMALFQYGGEHVSAASAIWLVLAAVLVIPSVPRLLPRGALRGARGLPSTVISRGVLAGAFFGTESFLPLMLVTRRGLSLTVAGFCLTASALGWCLGSWFQGRPSTHIARPRLIGIGSGLVAFGIIGVLLAVWPKLTPYLAAVGWSIAGLGMGLAMASVSVLVIQHSKPGEAGANSAALQVADTLGTLTGIGVGGIVYAIGGSGGASGLVFVTIFVLMLGIAVLGTVVGPRSALR
jgi:MFS family permease